MENKQKASITDLLAAAERGELDEVRQLVEYGFMNLCETDAEGNTPLAYAVRSGNLDLIRYLTERVGLNPRTGNRHGVTPYDLAAEKKQQEILDYFASRCGFRYEMSYHNPVRRGFYPDPSVIRVGADYYMVNSSFCYFPAIPVSHSRDLIHWNVIGYAITEAQEAGLDGLEGGRGYWAADISYWNGRYYIAATLRNNEDATEKRVQMVTSSRRPEGPYTAPAWIHEDGIDPCLVHDTDGRHYMILNRGARILELDQDCRTQITPAHLLWYGNRKQTAEGPHLLRYDGYYYLFQAEGGTGRGHSVTVSRARTLMGLYEPCPFNPILRQTQEEALLQCCGHGMPVDTPDGRWYMAYLCSRYSAEGYGILGRETSLDPMEWTSDGWPVINHGEGPGVINGWPVLPEEKEPAGQTPGREEHLSDDREDAAEGANEPVGGFPAWEGREWLSPRPLLRNRVKLQQGVLSLQGQKEDLSDPACRSILVERQQEFHFQAELSLVVQELQDEESYGMTAYYDEHSYIKFGLCRESGINGILIQEYVGDRYRSEHFHQLTAAGSRSEELHLQMETDGLQRSFFVKNGGKWEKIDTLYHTEYLSSEGLRHGKRFTGAMIGIYVQGQFTGQFRTWRTEYWTEETAGRQICTKNSSIKV